MNSAAGPQQQRPTPRSGPPLPCASGRSHPATDVSTSSASRRRSNARARWTVTTRGPPGSSRGIEVPQIVKPIVHAGPRVVVDAEQPWAPGDDGENPFS
jgi:hypothetical protein